MIDGKRTLYLVPKLVAFNERKSNSDLLVKLLCTNFEEVSITKLGNGLIDQVHYPAEWDEKNAGELKTVIDDHEFLIFSGV